MYRTAQNRIKTLCIQSSGVFWTKRDGDGDRHLSIKNDQEVVRHKFCCHVPTCPAQASNHGVGQGGAHNKSACVIKEKQKSEVQCRLVSLLSRAPSSL